MDNEEIKQLLLVAFQDELAQHLATLNRELLVLEQGVSQEEAAPLIAELFRAAHSLKGAAPAVGAQDIGDIAHRIEDVFGGLQRGKLTATPEMFDALFRAVDALPEALEAHLRHEALSPKKREEVLSKLAAVLGSAGAPESGPEPVSGEKLELPPEPVAGEKDESPSEPDTDASAPPERAEPEPRSRRAEQTRIDTRARASDTIRMSAAKLDALMADVGQLLVAHLRMDRRLTELGDFNVGLASLGRRLRDVVSALSSDRNGGLSGTADLVVLRDEIGALEAAMTTLTRQFSADCGFLSLLAGDLESGVRQARLVPVATLFDQFPRVVRDVARKQDKEVALEIHGGDTEADRRILELMKDPLTHLLRNAVDHGIESVDERKRCGKSPSATIRLAAMNRGNVIDVEVSDDGAGINLDAVRRKAVKAGMGTEEEIMNLNDQKTLDLIFHSGFSTANKITSVSGRGVGLDVVRENLEKMNGLVDVMTSPGQGTTFRLTLPLTVATTHAVLVEVAEQIVAVPTTNVLRVLRVDPSAARTIEGRQAIDVEGEPLPLVSLARVLQLSENGARSGDDGKVPTIVLGVAEKRVAFLVDAALANRELVIKSLGNQLKRVRNVAGASIIGSGEVVMMLNVADLVKSAVDRGSRQATVFRRATEVMATQAVRSRVLVVDDSITTRTLERNILENAGYQVLVASDGREAFALAQSERLDAVVSDVDMPRMNGFELTEQIRSNEATRDTPVVLVTSLRSQEDRARGLNAGADAYITKGTFDQGELLETLERLIG